MKYKKIKILILPLLLLFVYSNNLVGQKCKSTLTPNKILIGEQVELNINYSTDNKQKILWPLFLDSTENYKLDIIEKGKIDTLKDDKLNSITYTQKIIFTTFDTGFFNIQPIVFYGLDSTFISKTDSILLEVNTLPVDTTKAFKEIKEQMGEGVRFMEVFPWLIIIISIILITFGIFYYIQRKKKNKPLFSILKPKEVEPYIVALKSLEQLKNKKLWQNNRVKEYYIELSDILRIYIEKQFSIDAMEMITSEIIENLNYQKFEQDSIKKIQKILETADLVKFAKMEPLPNENDMFFNYSIDFVNDTKPQEPENDKIKTKN